MNNNPLASGNQAASQPVCDQVLYTKEQVETRIDEMAVDIIARYRHAQPVFVSLLNGAQPFTSKLMFAIARQSPEFHPNVQSMIVSRYGPKREPGALRLVTDLPPEYRDLTGHQAVVLDDLIDGGETLDYARQHLLAYNASQVEFVVLVKKRKDPPTASKVAIYGFEAPDVWLTGMGMDDSRLGSEANRWAEWIAVANKVEN